MVIWLLWIKLAVAAFLLEGNEEEEFAVPLENLADGRQSFRRIQDVLQGMMANHHVREFGNDRLNASNPFDSLVGCVWKFSNPDGLPARPPRLRVGGATLGQPGPEAGLLHA